MSAIDPHPEVPADLPAEPTAAEVVRSVLAAAKSLTLTTEGHRVELVGLHSVEAPDRLLVRAPAGSHLGHEVAHAPGGDVAATVEFTDVAPVAVPDRIRAKVVLGGWLAAAGESAGEHFGTEPVALCFEVALVELEQGGRMVDIDLDDLTRAEPDPLAETEAEMLTHLAGAHGDAVELLSQLVDVRLLQGVTRVDPLRLDRYGVVLRLQRAGGSRDVRLPFPARLRNPAHAVVQIQTLLARARTCPRRHHPRTRM
ncbi:DUF2470 domain-containing protein [Actinoallomurus bryophytorum]|uniref:DUF2470 domain-containing protein n=1 Tax=Actinoallomurus bryophytorum TaxID=1490222 RepID=A0A543CPH5_9ACTN|nr:DUF2470 domain-containing protein [Actinoallomurus bryophytorum]TQL99008.1 hypothetical protein FB559_4661 [Actinoallomurus bryophytorum]